MIRPCYVCDSPIFKGEPRTYVGTIAIHDYCSPDSGQICDTPNCAYRWCVHAGNCVV